MFAPAADKLLYHLDSIMTPCHTEIVMFSKSYITALTPNILNNLDVIFFFYPASTMYKFCFHIFYFGTLCGEHN